MWLHKAYLISEISEAILFIYHSYVCYYGARSQVFVKTIPAPTPASWFCSSSCDGRCGHRCCGCWGSGGGCHVDEVGCIGGNEWRQRRTVSGIIETAPVPDNVDIIWIVSLRVIQVPAGRICDWKQSPVPHSRLWILESLWPCKDSETNLSSCMHRKRTSDAEGSKVKRV